MARTLKDRLKELQQSVSTSTVCNNPLSSDGLIQTGFRREQECGMDYWVREIRYDVLTRHGKYSFQAIFEADLHGLQSLIHHLFHVSDLRFYDTETTGLGSGAGTFAFLHTIGCFEEDEFCLYQYFVDDFTTEELILQTLEKRHFSSHIVLVTFNGKSFDWPMLQNRRLLHRMEKIEICGHIDLIHLSRRLWRKTLSAVSLMEVESYVLGLVRQNDLPGREAPNRYFQYMDSNDSSIIEPVLQHNAMDVCSLVGILTHAAHLLVGRVNPSTASESTALGQYFQEWGQHDLAERCYITATEHVDAKWATYWRKSLFLKRLKRLDEARQVWQDMSNQFPNHIAPLVELAKLSEHKDKDYGKAEEWVRLAMERWKSHCSTSDKSNLNLPFRIRHKSVELAATYGEGSTLYQLQHRLNRIRGKQKL